MNDTYKISDNPSLDPFVTAVIEKKTSHVVILDVHEMTTVADTFIICSARSNRQVTAVAEYISIYLKKKGIKALNIEGKKEGHWVLMDYGHIIIHIFFEPLRPFYDLEGLWSDARRIKTKTLLEHEKNQEYDNE